MLKISRKAGTEIASNAPTEISTSISTPWSQNRAPDSSGQFYQFLQQSPFLREGISHTSIYTSHSSKKKTLNMWDLFPCIGVCSMLANFFEVYLTLELASESLNSSWSKSFEMKRPQTNWRSSFYAGWMRGTLVCDPPIFLGFLHCTDNQQLKLATRQLWFIGLSFPSEISVKEVKEILMTLTS